MQAERDITLMWSKQLFLAFIGLMAGTATAAGTFAFVMIIGVVPRMLAKWKRAEDFWYFENAIIAGGTIGSVLSLFPSIPVPLGIPLLIGFGISAGIFVGGIAVALAEILDTFPIVFRRFHIKKGLVWVMIAMALGKLVGSLYFFWADLSTM